MQLGRQSHNIASLVYEKITGAGLLGILNHLEAPMAPCSQVMLHGGVAWRWRWTSACGDWGLQDGLLVQPHKRVRVWLPAPGIPAHGASCGLTWRLVPLHLVLYRDIPQLLPSQRRWRPRHVTTLHIHKLMHCLRHLSQIPPSCSRRLHY